MGRPPDPLIKVDVPDAVRRALTTHTSRERLFSAIRTGLSNALYVYLDYPATRLPAKQFLREDRRQGGGLPLLHKMPSAQVTSAVELADYLGRAASAARASGLLPWGALVDGVADQIRASDLDDRKDFQGNWSDSSLPCGRCSMWFAGECMVAMDTRSPFINWRNTSLTYIPADLNQARCVFCGHSAPIETPALFYAAQRGQVIYSVPTRLPRLEQEAAPDFYREIVGGLRDEYRKHLTAEEAQRFDSASELLTYSLPEFLMAMQTGETLDEDHIYNLIRFPDGTGLLVDLSKGFARDITTSEMAWLVPHGAGYGASTEDMPRQTVADGPMKYIVQDAPVNPDGSPMAHEDLLEFMIIGLHERIQERPQELGGGWQPTLPSDRSRL